MTREAEKEWQYAELTLANVQALEGLDVTETRVVGIAVGACGTLEASTLAKLKALGIRATARSIAITALAKSAHIWAMHENG